MEDRQASGNSDSAKLDLILTAAELSQEGSQNGFGHGKKSEGSAQDMVDVLKKAGDISSDDAKIVKKAIKEYNKIKHEDAKRPVTEEQSKAFKNAANNVKDIIEEYKTEGRFTEV